MLLTEYYESSLIELVKSPLFSHNILFDHAVVSTDPIMLTQVPKILKRFG